MQRWNSERHIYADPYSGARVTAYTGYRGHSNHLYFTNSGYWDERSRVLFSSERCGRRDLYSVHLASGEITQITETAEEEPSLEIQKGVVSPKRQTAFVPRARGITAIDLRTGDVHPVYEGTKGYRPGILSLSSDEDRVIAAYSEDTLDEPDPRFVTGYNGFLRYFSSHPHSRIVSLDLNTGTADVLHEEDAWLAHVNCSPALPSILSFCHEGPWQEVSQRMWGMDTDSGKIWQIRPQKKGEYLGHEYWMSDGKRIGYHGHAFAGNGAAIRPVYGSVEYDNSSLLETPFPHDSHHYHSSDESLVVGDGPARVGRDFLLLWKKSGEAYHGPRVLCYHGSSRHLQALHVHPRMSPDRRQVIYTSDRTGYGQICVADVPDWDELPTEAAIVAGDIPR